MSFRKLQENWEMSIDILKFEIQILHFELYRFATAKSQESRETFRKLTDDLSSPFENSFEPNGI